MAADTYNICCLCYACHMLKWHRDTIGAYEWFNWQFPGRIEKLKESAREKDGQKQDWELIYNDLLGKYTVSTEKSAPWYLV